MAKKQEKNDIAKFGFLRIAAAVPRLALGNIEANLKEILECAKQAVSEDAGLILFPEMCLTGYTIADLFHQTIIREKSLEALKKISLESRKLSILMAVGLPMAIEGKLFNVCALIYKGEVLGIVPKIHLPGYKEFYEERWFSSGLELKTKEIKLFGKIVPVGRDILFRSITQENLIIGIEICEDLWTPMPPSSLQALSGATVILNPSASNELVGKADYRRELVSQQSARTATAYIYASSGVHESTTDIVFSGHAMIAENGHLLAESKRFERENQIIINDVDIDHLAHDRIKMTSFFDGAHNTAQDFRFVNFKFTPAPLKKLKRQIDPAPFVPQNIDRRDKVSEEIFNIQSTGLAKRLEFAGIKKTTLGLSGGLDSTLALLVAVEACKLLNLPATNIFAITMPGFGTTNRTKANAQKLAEALGVTLKEINITEGTSKQLKDIGHDLITEDTAFENAQARYRTMILMNMSNKIGGLVLGTGDLSEIALGWNSFAGDHISHYNVNAGIPKTLVKYLVTWVASRQTLNKTKKVLEDILDTPISPELVRAKNKQIAQKTEAIIGPYELHDFFLYHFIRWGEKPRKIFFLASLTFADKYTAETIKKWLNLFIKRFFGNQWKRSVMPDGPKVGSVALSPRGDWRMPSDADVSLWLRELNELE